ncbi:hypothetical protein BC936DRAFT_148920 [Jimgerdemannia flammicorona]|uniref:Uncharacterized protein n=1 Tax=Jimgerdemannia flammicorona TaxID=994334 RepID=A0A433D1Z9_9FUNG|nr:hypothetical protein BC936DRAFT_148920 [Jimgerdemannia flammicorona]
MIVSAFTDAYSHSPSYEERLKNSARGYSVGYWDARTGLFPTFHSYPSPPDPHTENTPAHVPHLRQVLRFPPTITGITISLIARPLSHHGTHYLHRCKGFDDTGRHGQDRQYIHCKTTLLIGEILQLST